MVRLSGFMARCVVVFSNNYKMVKPLLVKSGFTILRAQWRNVPEPVGIDC